MTTSRYVTDAEYRKEVDQKIFKKWLQANPEKAVAALVTDEKTIDELQGEFTEWFENKIYEYLEVLAEDGTSF
jgi:hypothetical protein